MPTIKKTALAEEDLIETWFHIAQDNPVAADRILDDFDEKFTILAHNPKAGVARPDIARELRYFPMANYLILYREIKDGVEIVRVVHSARLIINLSLDE